MRYALTLGIDYRTNSADLSRLMRELIEIKQSQRH